MQQGTSDSLLATAPSAPQMMQSRIYQQAAMRALDEGNADRARQIANDHLEPTDARIGVAGGGVSADL